MADVPEKTLAWVADLFSRFLVLLLLLLFPIVRADVKRRKKSSRSSYCEKDDFLLCTFDFWASVDRKKLGEAHLRVTSLSCFSFLFLFLGAENLFLSLNCFTSSYNISFEKINILSRLGGALL